MNIPDWYALVLLALASWRTWALISYDEILDGARRRLTRRGHRTALAKWLNCPYCSGFWVALAWWGLWQLWPHAALVTAAAVALTALVPLLERLSGD